jgi:hypothetical protein
MMKRELDTTSKREETEWLIQILNPVDWSHLEHCMPSARTATPHNEFRVYILQGNRIAVVKNCFYSASKGCQAILLSHCPVGNSNEF